MLAEPLTVTIDSVAQSLPAISRGADASNYKTADGVYTVTISRQMRRGRTRHVARIDHKGLEADPLTNGASFIPVTSSVYLVMDWPEVGYAAADIKNIALGLTGFLTSANLLKMLGGET